MLACAALAAPVLSACSEDDTGANPGGGAGGGSSGTCVANSDCSGGVCVRGRCEPGGGGSGGSDCETCGGGACVDLATDPLRCGSCSRTCEPGDLCVDGACGPGGPVAPYLVQATPAEGGQGQLVDVTLLGERFRPGAILHVRAAGPLPDVPATFISESELIARLDLARVPAGPLGLRVVNPDRTISNAVTFQVTAVAPWIDSLTPAEAFAGAPVTIQVAGSGFVQSSLCKVDGQDLPELGLPTQVLSGNELSCTFDLTDVQPGAYGLTVVNDGTLRSNRAGFTVLTVVPSLASLTPSSGRPGAQLTLTADGSGFDTTSVLRFDGNDLATTFVSGTRLFASLDLGGVEPGGYPVLVVNDRRVASNVLAFVVVSNPPELDSIDPSRALQEERFTLTALGRGFDATSTVHLVAPGGADAALPTVVVSATEATATCELAGQPPGLYLVAVVNAGGMGSNALPLEVVSNVAVLAGVTPAGAAQGTTVALTLSGANVLPGAAAHVSGSGLPDTPLPTTVVDDRTATVPALSLAGWDTGSYSLTLVNPGAAPSASAGFTVSPGVPTIAAISPGSATLGQVVSVTIRGDNFARPGAGAGGSTVHASAPSLGVSDVEVAATVASVAEITLALDTTTVAPGTYDVTIWNPGGNPPPQRSNAVQFTVFP